MAGSVWREVLGGKQMTRSVWRGQKSMEEKKDKIGKMGEMGEK